MGACNYEFKCKGKLNYKQIEKAYKNRLEDDRSYNGHQEGYSGDLQTFSGYDIKDRVFNSYNEAVDYCLEVSDKWGNIIVTYYKDGSYNKSKTHIKLVEKLTKLKTDKVSYIRKETEKLIKAQSKLISCKHCESKINRSKLKNHTCPVCTYSLLSTTVKNKIKKYENDITKLIDKIHENKIKLSKNSKNINTLFCGWAAC
jgi:hypothetical protein